MPSRAPTWAWRWKPTPIAPRPCASTWISWCTCRSRRCCTSKAQTGSNPEQLAALAQCLQNTRNATLEAERWLAGNYLARLAAGGDNVTFRARLSHVTSSGFTVRLEDSGLEGFVDLRKDPEKFSYDKWSASLTSTTRRFQLQQAVELRFLGVDADDQYKALFALVQGCGLKPPKADVKEVTAAAD